MNNILIITAVYPPEPVVSSRLAADLYHALRDKGYNVTVLHPKPTRPYGFDFQDCILGSDEVVVNSYTCPQSSLLGRTRESISFGRACFRYIRNNHSNIDLVYLGAWPLFGQYIAMKACVKYKLPVITPVQDIYPESLANKMPTFIQGVTNGLFRPFDRYVLKNSKLVHVISEKMRDYLAKTRNIQKENFVVVMNWQDESEFVNYQKNKQVDTQKCDEFVFMYLGNIGPVAGVDLLIESFILSNIKNSKLVIAGSGSMKEFLIEKAAHHSNIEFWEVPNGKVPEIQEQADCLLLPIKKGAASSSIPSKLPAYMFSAKPIIGCMDIDSDTASAIINSKCGIVIEPENPLLLSSNMILMTNKDRFEREQMGKMGNDYAMTHFAKYINLKKLVNAFESLVDNGGQNIRIQ